MGFTRCVLQEKSSSTALLVGTEAGTEAVYVYRCLLLTDLCLGIS